MKQLKIYTNGRFDGYTSFGIDYLHENFERMLSKKYMYHMVVNH